MAMDLGRKGGHIRMSWSGWRELLELAYNNGWEPMGTEAPMLHYLDGRDEHARDWCRTYFLNSHQIMNAKDAANLAAALERTWDSIPDETFDDGTKYRDRVKGFIRFCRAGSFHIG